MATLAKLAVELSLIDHLSNALGKTRSTLDSWGKSMMKTGGILTAGVTTPIVLGLGKAIMMASDLNEAVSASEAVYGNASKSVIAWSKTTAGAYGISQTEALTATTTLGSLYKGMGLTQQAAAGMSRQIVEAAGDMASFRNANPTDVLADMQSGLVGEYEPLKKYGILLNEASVQQKALAMTGKASADQLTEGEKVAARQALIMAQMGDAHGDAARTAGSLANQIRFLRKRGEDLAARWGAMLLPMASRFAASLGRLMDRIEKLSPRMQKLIAISALVAAAAGPVLIALGAMASGLAVLLGPIGLVVGALALLGVAYATNFLGFRDAVNGVVGAVVSFGETLLAAFDSGAKVSDLVKAFPEPLQGMARGFLLIADAIGDVVDRFQSGGFKGMLDYLPTALAQVWDGIKSVAGGLVSIALNTAVSIGGWLWDHKDDIWGGIKGLIGWTTDTFSDAITATIDGTLSLAGDLANAAGDFAGWLKKKIWRQEGVALAFGTLPFAAVLVYERYGEEIDRVAGQLAGALGPAIGRAITGLGSLASDIGSAIVTKIEQIDWGTLITADSFNVGVAVGAALRGAIAAAANLVADVGGAIRDLDWSGIGQFFADIDWSTVPGKIAEGIGTALVVGAAAIAAVGVAIASFIGGAIVGLVFGPDTDFASVVTKIKTGIQTAIDAAGAWTDMLTAKGVDLIIGLRNGAVARWNQFSGWLGTRGESAFMAIGSLLATLAERGTELIQGVRDGAGRRWNQFISWLSTRGDSAYNAVGSLASTLLDRGTELVSGLYAAAIDKWTIGGVVNWLKGRGAAAVSVIGDLGGTLAGAGWALMQGFANGITSGASTLVNAALDYVKGLLPSWARTALGYASPAKIMIPIGDGIAAGFAVGIERGARRYMADALEALSDPLGGGIGLGSAAMLAVGASGGTTNSYGGITINVIGAGEPDTVADRVFATFARELGLREGV